MINYQEISGPDQANVGIKYASISVLPKSSYVGTTIFFNTYAKLLSNPSSEIEIIYRKENMQSFGKACFEIGHLECPILQNEIPPDSLDLWKDLTHGHNIPLASPLKTPLLSQFSAEHRIVFIYRNPLDQFLSLYKYINRMPPDDAENGTPFDNEDFTKFVFKEALPAYIKFFYPFHVAKQKFPDSILFVPYEEIIQNREKSIRRILQHLDIIYDQTAFNTALALTSINSIKFEETRLQGGVFGRHCHIRNGGVGIWQDHLTPKVVADIETEFRKFGLSLHMFKVALKDDLQAQFAFLQPAATSSVPKQRLGYDYRTRSMRY